MFVPVAAPFTKTLSVSLFGPQFGGNWLTNQTIQLLAAAPAGGEKKVKIYIISGIQTSQINETGPAGRLCGLDCRPFQRPRLSIALQPKVFVLEHKKKEIIRKKNKVKRLPRGGDVGLGWQVDRYGGR